MSPADGIAEFLGLDVGGTQVKAGVLHAEEVASPRVDALVERTKTLDTDLALGAEVFLDRIADFVRELAPTARIALGFPGVFDPDTGRLVRSANLRRAEGLELGGELARRLDRPPGEIRVDNDANLATYGEQWLGAGRGVRDLVMLTLGTGVGGGIVLDGELFTGPGGKGAEIGHLIVRSLAPGDEPAEGLRCGCGAYGCLERLVSATAANRRARERGLAGDLSDLAARARAADGPERALFVEIGRDLGVGLLSVNTLLDIATFVVGGGFSAALDVLLPGVRSAYAERDYGGDPPRILPAELGGSAGWIGAARLAAESAGMRVG